MKGKKRIALVSIIVIACLVVTLPFTAGTKTYPLALVSGNSMFPNLQNGDLIYYKATDQAHITNGTIIVYVEGTSGLTFIDGLTHPIIIHRVIGIEKQSDGTVVYTTKGDNNGVNDPSLVRQDHVLGVVDSTVPKIGLLLFFIQSPQGLIATIGFIVVGYLSINNDRGKQEKKKDFLLGLLARKIINGDFPQEIHKKFELAVKYFENMKTESLQDPDLRVLVNWLKKDVLYEELKSKSVVCRACKSEGFMIESKNMESLVVCPHCGIKMIPKKRDILRSLERVSKDFDKVLFDSIDEALSALGLSSKDKVYSYLRDHFKIEKNTVVHKIDDFSIATEKIFGSASKQLQLLIIKNLEKKTVKDGSSKQKKRKATPKKSLKENVEVVRQRFHANVIEEEATFNYYFTNSIG